ncbi:hypothetical protein RISK_004666 [Rhodopirellula islandica]|uniref:Uncharacterized protein n=1 Tax=Rhodopirellula islandica TaxID=595434 RepID=A0A0J1ECT6_RHOIS|nr:hypothetical protein RISK_004666 [Rhodopirellula islandica]
MTKRVTPPSDVLGVAASPPFETPQDTSHGQVLRAIRYFPQCCRR